MFSIEAQLTQYLTPHNQDILLLAKQKVPQNHPNREAIIVKLEDEHERIIKFATHSIIRASIKKAHRTLELGGGITTILAIITVVLNGFSLFSAWMIATPLLTSLAAWFINIITIPILFEERLEGGMTAIIEKEIRKDTTKNKLLPSQKTADAVAIEIDEPKSPGQMNAFKMFAPAKTQPVPPRFAARRATV